MSWSILYHKNVEGDLESIGAFAAKRVLRAIDDKLSKSPLQFGSPLSGGLANFRKLRVGDYRIVYQVIDNEITVYALAVGPRRVSGGVKMYKNRRFENAEGKVG